GVDQVGEVPRSRPQQRLVDDRRVARRRLAVLEGLVDRLSRGLALYLRILAGVVGGARLVGERGAVALEKLLEVGPVRRLQRGEDLIELHRGRGVGDRNAVAAVEVAGAGAARTEIEEEVA